jgi:hypothetical protein
MMMKFLIKWLLSFATIEGIVRDELRMVECGCESLLGRIKDLNQEVLGVISNIQFVKNLHVDVDALDSINGDNEIVGLTSIVSETLSADVLEGDVIGDDEMVSRSTHSIDNDEILSAKHHAIEPINIDFPMSKAMESPNDLCSFDTCTNYINLFARGQEYHLLSTVHVPILQEQKCHRAFIVSSMPYSGSELQMLLIEKLLVKAGLNFRSHVYYNFHAHAELDGQVSLQWMNDFNDFTSTLNSEEYIVIRAPYKDDDIGASQLCSTSIKINSMRSLVDIALLRFHRRDAASRGKLPAMNLKEIMDYIRSLLMHQRYWAKNALTAEMLVDDKDSMTRFLTQICEKIGHLECNAFDDILESDEVVEAVKEMSDQEMYLRNIRNSAADDETKQVQYEVSQVFRSWIQRHSY